MFVRVPLNRVVDNPFQTRIEYGDVTDLVESLLKMKNVRPTTSGLIQVPPARVVAAGRVLNPDEYGGVPAVLGDEPEAVVEIAAGHRRLRAFRQLFEAGETDYASFPVDVQVLDEQAMADIAWEENAKRKDLSPIEEAQALQRAIERFGWTQAQVGERWGLSQSAVANKLRLLQLPADAQEAIRSGQISERHGRVLLAARAKSERVYERLAEDVLPVSVPDQAMEKAKSLIGQFRFNETQTPNHAGETCNACGSPIPAGTHYFHWYADGYHFLCLACYRAARNWTPPSVSEAEEALRHAVNRERNDLTRASWPLDEAVGEENPAVRSARCVDCQLQEQDGDRIWCYDGTCFGVKKQRWYAYQIILLEDHLNLTFGDIAAVTDKYGGYDLRSYDGVDKALVESGACAPGKCDRLRFRYVTYQSPSSIYPHPGLPFVYNCDNANAHHGCQRRYLASERSEDEMEKEKQTQKQAAERRGQARAMMGRATLAMARALLDGHAGAWKRLVTHIGGMAKDGQSAEAAAKRVAETLLDMRHIVTTWRFELDETLELVETFITDEMRKAGVALLPSADDLTRKLERIAAFVLDDELISPRQDLTPAQVTGNLVNLDRIHAQAEDLHEAGTLPDQDFIRLNVWACELREALNSISREIP